MSADTSTSPPSIATCVRAVERNVVPHVLTAYTSSVVVAGCVCLEAVPFLPVLLSAGDAGMHRIQALGMSLACVLTASLVNYFATTRTVATLAAPPLDTLAPKQISTDTIMSAADARLSAPASSGGWLMRVCHVCKQFDIVASFIALFMVCSLSLQYLRIGASCVDTSTLTTTLSLPSTVASALPPSLPSSLTLPLPSANALFYTGIVLLCTLFFAFSNEPTMLMLQNPHHLFRLYGGVVVSLLTMTTLHVVVRNIDRASAGTDDAAAPATNATSSSLSSLCQPADDVLTSTILSWPLHTRVVVAVACCLHVFVAAPECARMFAVLKQQLIRHSGAGDRGVVHAEAIALTGHARTLTHTMLRRLFSSTTTVITGLLLLACFAAEGGDSGFAVRGGSGGSGDSVVVDSSVGGSGIGGIGHPLSLIYSLGVSPSSTSSTFSYVRVAASLLSPWIRLGAALCVLFVQAALLPVITATIDRLFMPQPKMQIVQRTGAEAAAAAAATAAGTPQMPNITQIPVALSIKLMRRVPVYVSAWLIVATLHTHVHVVIVLAITGLFAVATNNVVLPLTAHAVLADGRTSGLRTVVGTMVICVSWLIACGLLLRQLVWA